MLILLVLAAWVEFDPPWLPDPDADGPDVAAALLLPPPVPLAAVVDATVEAAAEAPELAVGDGCEDPLVWALLFPLLPLLLLLLLPLSLLLPCLLMRALLMFSTVGVHDHAADRHVNRRRT
jgi:hypothetical protein